MGGWNGRSSNISQLPESLWTWSLELGVLGSISESASQFPTWPLRLVWSAESPSLSFSHVHVEAPPYGKFSNPFFLLTFLVLSLYFPSLLLTQLPPPPPSPPIIRWLQSRPPTLQPPNKHQRASHTAPRAAEYVRTAWAR